MSDSDSDEDIHIWRRRDIGDPESDPEDNRARDIPIAHHYEHPPLPITAPDFSYIMDLTDLRSLLAVKNTRDKKDIRNEVSKIVTNAVNNKRVNKGYRYLLSIIDTTSRKGWMYPLKLKDADSVWVQFKKFLNDVHGKIARLLSDHDTAFSRIRDNNDSFTYCSVVADHNNHKTLSLIDRFTKTFRELLYIYFRDHAHGPNYSWYTAYPIVLDTYNNSKHQGLFLRGLPKRNKHGDIKKFYYTPNQVWFSPRLRSRIRLRKYFDGYQNYLPGSLYDRIKRARRVRVRMLRDDLGHGGDAFSDVTYEKGRKEGNAWLVNNRWYTYRNLWPVDEKQSHDKRAKVKKDDSESMKIAKRRIYRSKYKFKKAQQRWLKNHPLVKIEKMKAKKVYKNPKGISVRKAREIGELRLALEKRDGRDTAEIGLDYINKVRKENNKRYNLRNK